MTFVTNDMVHYGTMSRAKGASQAKVSTPLPTPYPLVACWLVRLWSRHNGPRHYDARPYATATAHSEYRVLFADKTSPFVTLAELGVAHDEAAAGLDRAARRTGHG